MRLVTRIRLSHIGFKFLTLAVLMAVHVSALYGAVGHECER